MSRNDSQKILDLTTKIILDDAACNPNRFKKMQPDELFHYIKVMQTAIQKESGIECTFRNAINFQAIEALTVNAMEGCCIAMRHGEQESKYIAGLDNETAKIMQMRSLHNINDEITERSAIEFIATMIIFKYLKDKLNIQFQIHSSHNQRALQPALALAKLLEVRCKSNPALDCVNYPDANILSDDQLKLLLDKGTLPWKKEAVDGICGTGTFDNICQNMRQAFDTRSLKPRQVRLMFTHTQQTNAICEAQKQAVTRFDHYGLVGLSALSRVFLYDQGLYHHIHVAAASKQATFQPAKIDTQIPPKQHTTLKAKL